MAGAGHGGPLDALVAHDDVNVGQRAAGGRVRRSSDDPARGRLGRLLVLRLRLAGSRLLLGRRLLLLGRGLLGALLAAAARRRNEGDQEHHRCEKGCSAPARPARPGRRLGCSDRVRHQVAPSWVAQGSFPARPARVVGRLPTDIEAPRDATAARTASSRVQTGGDGGTAEKPNGVTKASYVEKVNRLCVQNDR